MWPDIPKTWRVEATNRYGNPVAAYFNLRTGRRALELARDMFERGVGDTVAVITPKGSWYVTESRPDGVAWRKVGF